MDLGVHLPLMQFGEEPLSLRRLEATVDAARDCGFAAVSANDHLVFQTPWLDGLAALASIVGRSGELTLATTVSLAVLRGPVPLAKALTALDVLSEGRLIAGVGPGSSERDYRLAGIPFEERWKRFDEAVAVLRALLRGEPMPEQPRYYPVPPDVALAPGPYRPDGIPLWIGSWGSKAGLARVARAGDGWLASAYNTTPEQFAAARAALEQTLRDRGREADGFPNALATMWTWVSKDRAEGDRVLTEVLAPALRRDPESFGRRSASVRRSTAPSSCHVSPRPAAGGSTCGRWAPSRGSSRWWRRRSGDRDDRLDLDRHPERQLAGADRRAGVASGVAPELEDQVTEAVDGGGGDVEVLRALDEAEHLDPDGHPVELAELLLERREHRQGGGAGGVVGLLDGDLGSTRPLTRIRSPSDGPWPEMYARSPCTRTSSNGSFTPGGAASGAGSSSPSSASRSSIAPIAPVCQPAPSAALEVALMAGWAGHATLGRMEALQQIAAIAIGCGAAALFALMAWAGQHQS